jgi:hypothetical protein
VCQRNYYYSGQHCWAVEGAAQGRAHTSPPASNDSDTLRAPSGRSPAPASIRTIQNLNSM